MKRQSLWSGLFAMSFALALCACGPTEPKSSGAPPDMRRLTDDQYRNAVADIFGSQIVIGGGSDPLARVDGLLAVSARTGRITSSGFEHYYDRARAIAAQVVAPENRGNLLPCRPVSETRPDDACAEKFFAQVGRLLYRRPLSDAEIRLSTTSARAATAETGDFYRGVALALADMMATPKFLFAIDTIEPDPSHTGLARLTSYAKATRLSFFLWNTTPDDMLLRAAEKGELNTKAGLARQVDRMMASDRLDNGLRAFLIDFLGFDKFETLEKDSIIYPAFNGGVARDAMEQVLRTATEHLLVENGDYRDLFTTRKTFLTGALARLYKVPVARPKNGWVAYAFPKDDPRAGLLTEIGFSALASHPGRSSPTLRGRAIRESLLCQTVPDPPGDVDFSNFNDPQSVAKTARERLAVHATAPACAGCHKITDPIGLALENFDGAGQFRTTENGVMIDTSGVLDGVAYTDAAGLGQALHDSPAVPACLVRRLFTYSVGRPMERTDREILEYFGKRFAADGYKVSELMKQIALSDAFYAVSSTAPAETAPPRGHTASLAEDKGS